MILLTTTKEKCEEISQKYSALSFYHFPCIEYTKPNDDYKALDAAIRSNHLYEWIFFLSQKAAETYFERLLAIGGNFFNLSNHLKFAVIGETTKEFLETQVNMPIDFMPSKANSNTFIEEFCSKYKYDFECAFKVLLPRSELAQDDFKEKLDASKNYNLEIVPAYNTIKANPSIEDLKANLSQIEAVIFMSTSCVHNFANLSKGINFDTKKFYSIGSKTSKAIKEYFPNHKSIIEAAESNLESILALPS